MTDLECENKMATHYRLAFQAMCAFLLNILTSYVLHSKKYTFHQIL